MKRVLALPGFFLASLEAKPLTNRDLCGFHAAEAVDEALDTTVFIATAGARCGKYPDAQSPELTCAIDTLGTIASVDKVVNSLLKSARYCSDGKLMTAVGERCAMAASTLAEAMLGVAHSATAIAKTCYRKAPGATAAQTPTVAYAAPKNDLQDLINWVWRTDHLVNSGKQMATKVLPCTFNAKEAMMAVVRAVFKAKQTADSCGSNQTMVTHPCGEHAFELGAALTSLGEYVAAAFGRCAADQQNFKSASASICASDVFSLLKSLETAGAAGLGLAHHCTAVPRLYEESSLAQPPAGISINMALAALFPLTAMLSFVVGSRFAKSCPEQTIPPEVALEMHVEE